MGKWYSITGTYEYLVEADSKAAAIEQAEEDFANNGMGILSVSDIKEY